MMRSDQFKAVSQTSAMSYFTDKAFSSSFLSKSKCLSDMIVKKEDDDELKLTRAGSVFSSREDRAYDDSYLGSSMRTRQPAPRRDYLSSTLLSETKNYDRPSSSRPSSSSSCSVRSGAASRYKPIYLFIRYLLNHTKIN